MSDWIEQDGKKYFEEGYFELCRNAAKSEARKELAEITAKLFPELRDAIRSAVWSETETIQGAMAKALENVRAEAGRERAVRELEALAEAFGVTPGEVQAKDASVSYGLAKAACFISAACAKEARRRIEEIAKEGV